MAADGAQVVALTGATGFLGSHIADALLQRNHRVRVGVRPTSNLRWIAGKPLEVREVDLLSPESCAEFLEGTGAVIHCAGVVSATSEEAYQIGNVATTEALLEAARKSWPSGSDCPPVFLLISSLAAHGPAGLDNPAREDQPDQPITAYGRSKLAAEKLLLQESGSWRQVILRPPGLYGPRDRDFLPLFKAARRGLTARLGSAMTGLSLVDGRDAATAAVKLLETSTARGIYYVDDGHRGYNWSQLAAALGAACGRRVRVLNLPLVLLKLAAALVGKTRATRSPVLNPDRLADLETPGWVCDGTKLVNDTGFQARFGLETGFTDTVTDLRERGWL